MTTGTQGQPQPQMAAGGLPRGFQPQGQQAQMPPREIMSALLRNPQTRAVGIEFLKAAQAGRSPGFALETMPDGTVLKVDRSTGEPEVLIRGSGAGGDERFFGNPLFMEDEEGNVIAGQLSNQGGIRPLETPEGTRLLTPTRDLNLGHEAVTQDRFGRELTRRQRGGQPSQDQRPTPEGGLEAIPGSELERERAVEEAREVAGRDVTGRAAQTVFEDTERMIDIVDQFGRAATGTAARLTPGVLSEAPANRLQQHIESVKGNIGIDSLLRIKASGAGLGHIPQSQLDMLAGLLGRLDSTMNIDELRFNILRIQEMYADIVRSTGGDPNVLYRERLERIEGGGQGGQPQDGGPQPGTIEDGYRFKGGDPADPNAWERVR